MKALLLWIIALTALPASMLHAEELVGTWQGTLKAGPQELRIVIKISMVDDKLKAEILKQQSPIADAALELNDLVETLTDAKLGLQKAGEEDKNKFWQATFRFALAQAKMRLAFIHEANLALGQIRTDSIPDTANASGLRLVQKAKMTDKKNAPLGKQALEQLAALAQENKGTPFEVLAKQWRAVSLGLEWKPKKSDADTTMEMKEEKK